MHNIAMNQRATCIKLEYRTVDTPNKESWNLFNHPTMIKTPNFLRVDNTVRNPYLTDVGLNTLVSIYVCLTYSIRYLHNHLAKYQKDNYSAFVTYHYSGM